MKKKGKSSSRFPLLMIGLGVVILIGGVAVFGRTQESEAGKYDTFAQCLYDSGMRMYGSVTCSFCARQRELFGGSFEYIREIECDPRNAGNETERCIAKNITHTPTWIQEDEEGEELYRFEAGVVPLKELSEISKCPLVEDIVEE